VFGVVKSIHYTWLHLLPDEESSSPNVGGRASSCRPSSARRDRLITLVLLERQAHVASGAEKKTNERLDERGLVP
jgi:hypothetical protein